MKEKLYQVLFDATTTGKFDLDTTKGRFSKLFGLKPPVVKKLFSGDELVIRKDLTEDDAREFSEKIAQAGGKSVIGRMPEDDLENDDLENDDLENTGDARRNGERRIRYRRDARPGAMVDDRRMQIRRIDDADNFEELILNQDIIPIGFSSYKPGE